MAATLTPNRETALAAMWWLFDGGTFIAVLADTTGAASPPALDADFFAWQNYWLPDNTDVFVPGGTIAYDATNTNRAVVPQIEIVLTFAIGVTYTDVQIYVIPGPSPGSNYPNFAYPYIGLIHEPSAVTLAPGATKTYKLDLYSEWL